MDEDRPLDPARREEKHDLIARHLEGPVADEPWTRRVATFLKLPGGGVATPWVLSPQQASVWSARTPQV